MRTNINLDDELVHRLMDRTGIKTKRAIVDAALKEMDRILSLKAFLNLRGKVTWEGDLDEMRGERSSSSSDDYGVSSPMASS